jgi:hypothetical protein
MTTFIGSLVILRSSIALAEPPLATTDVVVIGGAQGEIISGAQGEEIGAGTP